MMMVGFSAMSGRSCRTYLSPKMAIFERSGTVWSSDQVEQGKTYEDLLENTVKIEFRGHTIHVLDIKTMIELKKNPRILKISNEFLFLKKHFDI